MTPDQFIAAGQRLYGKKFWKAHLARDLGIDVSTIHRLTKREQIPGPYEIAVKAMLINKQAQDKLEKEVRELLPRKLRRRSPANVAKRQAVKARRLAGARRAADGAQPGADRPHEAADLAGPADRVVEAPSDGS